MTPPIRRDDNLDAILSSYLAEDTPTDRQTVRALTAIITKVDRIQNDLDELRDDKKEENSARIQIMQAKRGTFEIVQFAATSITALAMFVIALIEIYQHAK